MIHIKPINWDNNYLEGYIYNNGTPKEVKEVLSNNLEFIYARIDEYKENIGNFQCISEYDFSNLEDLKNKLYGIYKSTSENIKILKENIRKISQIQCPYCYLQVQPYEIDHYLPRNQYPEFSILTLNLVPACPECNSRFKGKIYKIEDNLRAFIHPYYDVSIMKKCFLNCSLTVEENLLSISYFIDTRDLTEEESKIVVSHFEKLKLNDRYKLMVLKEFEKFYKRFTVIVDNKRQYKRNITRKLILEKIEEEESIYYDDNCNYYVKVFWKKFKECEDCLRLIYDKKIKL